MKITLIIMALLVSSSVFASKCKIRFEVEIKKNENTRSDYAGCSMDIFDEVSYARRSIKIKDLENKQDCQTEAENLIGQRTEVVSLVMVVPYADDAIYSYCKGTIINIKKVKFKK